MKTAGLIISAFIVASWAGCNGDGNGDGDPTDTGTGDGDGDGTGDGDGDGDGTGDGDGDGDGSGGELECADVIPDGGYEIYPPLDEPAATLQLTTVDLVGQYQALCSDLWPESPLPDEQGVGNLALNHEMSFENNEGNVPFEFVIRRPQVPDSEGEWPEGKFPLVVFTHGNGGQNGEVYDHIWESVVESGAVVASVKFDYDSVAHRRAVDLVCMARYFATMWPDRDRLNCDLAFGGHSNGGEGMHIAARWLELHPDPGEEPASLLTPRGSFGIASGHINIDDVGVDFGYFANSPWLDGSDVAPYLVIEGSNDDDVPQGTIRNYLLHTPEHTFETTDADRYSVWAYDVDHDGFGGMGPLKEGSWFDSDDEDHDLDDRRLKGHTIAAEYIGGYLRHVLFEDASALPYLRGDAIPSAIDVPRWWQHHPSSVADTPLLLTSFEPTSDGNGAWIRERIDTMSHHPDTELEVSTEGMAITVEPATFVSNLAVAPEGHLSNNPDDIQSYAMRADWAFGDEGSISWDVSGLDLTTAHYVSFRAANHLDITKTNPAGTSICELNSPAILDLRFAVSLRSNGEELYTFYMGHDEGRWLPAQSFKELLGTGGEAGVICTASDFLRTIRLPLDEVCDDVDLTEVDEITFSFGQFWGSSRGSLILDSLELQHDPNGALVCPSP